MWKLSQVPAVIKPGTAFKDAVTAAGGVNAKPRRMTEVELHLEVNVTDCLEQVEDLFPGADHYCKLVAGLEQQCKGEDRSARTKLPEMDVTIWYGADKDPVFISQASAIKARVQLKINEDGDGKIIIKPRVRLDNKALTDMAQLIKAEVKVSMEPSQMDLADATIPEPSEKKKGKRGAKSATLHDIDDDGIASAHH